MEAQAMSHIRICPDCESSSDVSRREFLKTAGAAALAVGAAPLVAKAAVTISGDATPESVAKLLYESLSDEQKKAICFAWDYMDPKRGLLRTRISNNWNITEPKINSDFYTSDQQAMIRTSSRASSSPIGTSGSTSSWRTTPQRLWRAAEHRHVRQAGREVRVRDDRPAHDLALRRQQLRHVAFGGPIFYGHAADGFNEKKDHPGNVFWPQALAANKVYEMLDEKQRKQALVDKLPREEKPSRSKGPAAVPWHPRGRDVERPEEPGAGSAAKAGRALSPERPRRSPVRSRTRKAAWTSARWPSIAKATSATTRCGIAGGWKAHRSSGTSAAPRTSTCGSTWPTTRA